MPEVANVDDAKEILQLQKLAYQSEAVIYNNYTIPPSKCEDLAGATSISVKLM